MKHAFEKLNSFVCNQYVPLTAIIHHVYTVIMGMITGQVSEADVVATYH